MSEGQVTVKRFQVIDGPLSVRDEPGGNRTGVMLAQGTEIASNTEPITKDGYVWVKHDKGWSAFSDDDETEVYMLDVTNRDPDAPRIFRVWSSVLSVRDAANGKRLPTKLYCRDEIKVDVTSRTETGKYIWWKHDKGWSAERSLDGNQVFMKEVFDRPASVTVPESKRVQIPDTWKGTVFMQVAQNVKVRGEPSTNPRGLIIRTIKRGKTLEVDMDTLTESDGYYWARHDLGWSAVQSVDGKTVFLAEPGTVPGLVFIGPNGPKAEDLPQYRALVTRLPVNLEQTRWFQYFGNNMFAMRYGSQYGYDRYSQGLHGGLDFGNSDRPVPVYAGVEAEYVKTEYPSPNNTRIFLKSGDYTLVYQHITSARTFQPGQVLTPDTQIAQTEHHSINNGWDHLHFEVRFMNDWIVNPLLLFTEELYNKLTAKFDPSKPNDTYQRDFPRSVSNFFYHTDTWTKWTTPLEQPMIKLQGPLAGPRAELDKTEW